MLTPKQWEIISKQAGQIYNQLELDIIEEIATRIANVGYANTVVHNGVLIAQEMGLLYQDIVSLVAKNTEKSNLEIQEIFKNAGIETLKFDDKIYKEAGLNPISIKQSKSMLQFLTSTAIKTNNNLKNLCMTTANTRQQEFINAMDNAYLEVSTGVKSYSSSIIDTIKELSKTSSKVEYPSGYKTSIENAVRMNIITGVNQTCGKLQEMRADELGWDLMELTAHSGARPEHAEWQGKIVSRSGQKGYLSLDDIGYGEPTGFKGVNCRHDWYPYFKGSSRTYTQEQLNNWKNETVTYNGQKISKYDASQLQRRMERQIRQDKKDIAGLQGILTSNNKDDTLIEEAKQKLRSKQNKLNEHNSILNDFVKQTDSKKDYNRLYIGNAKTENVLKKRNNNSIIIRNKKNINKRFDVPKEIFNDVLDDELKNIKFPVKPEYNSRIRDNGKTIATTYPWGEVKEIKSILIGKQNKETREFLIDTFIHEKLEAKILITKTDKYKKLNEVSDEERHRYINKIIKRYFKMKGWNYKNA